ncbi:hypothetical protein CCP2SC5_920013 [Azospirillaceae bacterium]
MMKQKTVSTLHYHKSVIKKACSALVKDGYDRNQAIGALIEFFLADKTNSPVFNTVMKSYLAILKDDFGKKKFNPWLPSKTVLAEIRKGRK